MRKCIVLYCALLLSLASAGQQPVEKGRKQEQAEALLTACKQAEHKGDYAGARSYARQAIAAFTQLNNINQVGEAYVMLWSISVVSNAPFEDRIAFIDTASTFFRQSGNKLREADCLIQLGDLYQSHSKWGTALPILKRSLDLYQAAGYKQLQAIYDVLGAVQVMLGDYKEGVRYGLLAASTAEELGDTSMILCTIFNRVAMAYMETKDPQKARQYFQRSLAVAVKYDDLGSTRHLVYNIVDLLLKTGKPAEALRFVRDMMRKHPQLEKAYPADVACMLIGIYMRLDLYNEARPYNDIIEKALAKGIDNNLLKGHVITRIILFYIGTKQFDKAAAYADIFTAFSNEMKIGVYAVDDLLLRFKIDSATGHYVSAINYYQHYKNLKDSLFNESKSRQVSQLNILYETEKKDKNILVLEKQSELQQSNLRQATIMRNVILGGLALLLLILFLLYKGYRNKQKNNQALEAKQEEINHKNQSLERMVKEKEWLLKEIHHRVKNNLHMVVGLLASQTEFLKGQEAFDAISESQHRVQAMSLIHQKLYQTDDLSSIDMPSYILELVEYLKSSFDKKLPIRFKLDIVKVDFPLSHSIPLGLIINEAITNCIKYAFPNGREGEIHITLEEPQPAHFRLCIRDNGVGLPAGFDPHSYSTLGTTLMQGLSDDIRGDFSISNDQGTKIVLAFVIPESHQTAGAVL
jgi:two-component sensor histidine kinase